MSQTFLTIENGPQTDAFSETEALYSMFQASVTARRKRTEQWRRNYMLAMNRWGRSNDDPRDSEVFPIMRARVGWMTDQEIAFNLTPSTDPFSPYAQMEQLLCEHLETVLRANFIAGDWMKQIIMAIWDAGLYGAGIMKAVWDSGLDGGIGNVDVQRVDPWVFWPDPNATSFRDCEHFFVKHRWSLAEIERRFPDLSDSVLEALAESPDQGWDQERKPQTENWPKYSNDGVPVNLGQGTVAVGGPGQGTFRQRYGPKGINVLECWRRHNERDTRETTDPLIKGDEEVVHDEWEVTFFSGPIVLLKETAKALWDQDMHPYVRYVDDEMGEFWSTPIVSHLAPCQMALNGILTSIMGNINLVCNPVFLDVEGSGINRTPMINKPGQRLTLKNTQATTQNKPQWLVPPNLPSMVMEQAQFWIERMENISGLQGTTKGQQAQGRQAVATVQATQEAGFVSIRSSLRNLEGTLGQLGQILVSLIMVNYDTHRTVAIVGEEGTSTSLKLAANHFFRPTKDGLAPLRFQLLVEAGSNKPTSRGARIAEIDHLKEMGAVDNQTVLQIHQIPHAAQIQQRMQQEAQAAAEMHASMAAKSEGRGPGMGHPH
jgi:hypothetical protein